MTELSNSIRLLPSSDEPATAQLAAGSALIAGLEETGLPALRWYRITPTTLLLGSAQRPHEVDGAACTAAGIALHKRRSGGGVVLGGPELLLLDLALPRGHPLYLNDVTLSYKWLGEVWAAALHQLGIDARVVSVAEARTDTHSLDPLTRRVCFGGLSPYEVLADGRKLVGLAQMRRRPGALFQAGLYLRWEPQRTAALLAASEAERAELAERLARRVVGLEELCDNGHDVAAVKQAFAQALTAQTGLSVLQDAWNHVEHAAREAAVEEYQAIECS